MNDINRVNADELDQLLDEAAVTFPASVDEIKSGVADVGVSTDVMMFFEEIQPGTRFDHKEELLNMAEQRTSNMITEDAGMTGDTTTADILEDDELF